MRIGQDHVAATVNTLVLAYAGASLPMLLMFSLARGDYGYLVNFSFIAEEIVRTLVGSLGLIAAVPLTTAIAILFAQRAESLGVDAAGHLSRNDAYVFFDQLNDLLRPGPSGTNVNDLIFLIAL